MMWFCRVVRTSWGYAHRDRPKAWNLDVVRRWVCRPRWTPLLLMLCLDLFALQSCIANTMSPYLSLLKVNEQKLETNMSFMNRFWNRMTSLSLVAFLAAMNLTSILMVCGSQQREGLSILETKCFERFCWRRMAAHTTNGSGSQNPALVGGRLAGK